MDIKELKESWAKEEKAFKQIVADMPNPTADQTKQMMEYMWNSMSSLRNQMWDLYDNHANALSNHASPQNGIHPPKLLTASHLQSYLDSCGMENDVEVAKPTIYVKASRNGVKNFDVDLKMSSKV